MNNLLIIFQVSLLTVAPPDSIVFDNYSVDEGYIIQEINLNMHPQHHPQFAGTSAILSDFGEYFFLKEAELLNALEKNELKLNNTTMVVDPSHNNIFAMTEKGDYKNMRVNYTVGLTKLLQLDDTGIYRIGESYYVVRLIRYAYIDGIHLNYRHYEDGDLRRIEGENVRLFLFTLNILSTSPTIEKFLWKKKYEMPKFWQKNEEPR